MTDRIVPARIRAIDLPPFDPLNQRAAQLRDAGHHVISLGQALPFFSPPPSALAAARDALTHDDVHRYSTDPGRLPLRSLLAGKLSPMTSGGVDAADLLITAGANHAFTLALTTLVDAGDDVLLPAPYFTNHQMAIVARGATPIEAPVADRAGFTVRWTDIEPRLTPRTKAVVLCTPSNPTGAAIDPDEGRRIVSELAARGVVVLSDETYLPFVYDGDPWSAAAVHNWRRNVAVIGTFSKAFGMMGWRVGFMMADAAICAQATKVQDAMIICAPVVSQMAVEGALRHDWHYAQTFHGEFRARRQMMAQGISDIPRLHWTPAPAGLFAFARVHGCTDSEALARTLLEEAHVVTIPGAAFGSSGEGYLRLSFGFATRPDLAEALDRLRLFFEWS